MMENEVLKTRQRVVRIIFLTIVGIVTLASILFAFTHEENTLHGIMWIPYVYGCFSGVVGIFVALFGTLILTIFSIGNTVIWIWNGCQTQNWVTKLINKLERK